MLLWELINPSVNIDQIFSEEIWPSTWYRIVHWVQWMNYPVHKVDWENCNILYRCLNLHADHHCLSIFQTSGDKWAQLLWTHVKLLSNLSDQDTRRDTSDIKKLCSCHVYTTGIRLWLEDSSTRKSPAHILGVLSQTKKGKSAESTLLTFAHAPRPGPPSFFVITFPRGGDILSYLLAMILL